MVLIFWSFCIKAKGHITDAAGNKLRKEVLNDSIILTGPFTENQYQARFITTDGQPTALDSTLLVAQDSIVFKPGFHAKPGLRLTAKIDSTLVPIDQTDYIGGIEYRNGGIQAIYHPEGRAVPSASNWRHEYVITDHLGNTRLRFSDLDGNSQIDSTEILDEIAYYPFGVPFQPAGYRYTYNGKELDWELGLSLHFYGFRLYDPTIGRFSSIDPLNEEYINQSPYVYAANNPSTKIDVMGLAATNTQDLIRTAWIQGTGTYDNDGNRIENRDSQDDENCCPGGIHPLGQIEAAKIIAKREGKDFNEVHNDLVKAHLATQDEVAISAIGMVTGEWIVTKLGSWAYRLLIVGSRTKRIVNVIPKGKLANHIFSGKSGKFIDNAASRRLITDLTNNRKYLQGVDRYGKSWFARTMDDGTQIYGYTQNGVVKGAGINQSPVNLIKKYNLK